MVIHVVVAMPRFHGSKHAELDRITDNRRVSLNHRIGALGLKIEF